MMRVGNRVPRDFFVTSGVGESDITVHAGSYHLALHEAGIEMANIVTYSSILPATAVECPKPARHEITHGEVMECIQAVSTAEYGSTASCGIIWGWLFDENEKPFGGLVCEYNGNLPEDAVPAHLREMLDELHTNGYGHLRLEFITTKTAAVTPTKMYGTALVSLCFTSYDIEVLS